MAFTRVQAMNETLMNLGMEPTIVDEDEGSTESVILSAAFDVAFQKVLKDHNWNFATKRRSLSLTGNSPVDWAFEYHYPNDCVKAQGFEDADRNAEKKPFKVEKGGVDKIIKCDVDSAVLIYTEKQSEITNVDADFMTAFSWYLAHRGCVALTGDKALWQACITTYRNFISQASTNDANEGTNNDSPDAAWEEAKAI